MKMRLSKSTILLNSLHCLLLMTYTEAKDLQDDMGGFLDQEGNPATKIINRALKTVGPEAETDIGTGQVKITPLSKGTGPDKDWDWWNKLNFNYSSPQYSEIPKFQNFDYEKILKDLDEANRLNDQFKNMPKFEVPKNDWPKLDVDTYTSYKDKDTSYNYTYSRSSYFPSWLIVVFIFKIIIIVLICLRRCGVCETIGANARARNGNIYARMAEPAAVRSLHTVIIVSGPNDASPTAAEDVPKPENDLPPSYESVVKTQTEGTGLPSYDQHHNTSPIPKEPSA